jgi:rhodanese-related sulfurtransferase
MLMSAPSVSPSELARRIGTSAAPRVLDVRRREVFDGAARVIAGAKWRQHDAVERWADELAREREVVAYCAHGHQVGQAAAARLRAMGLEARYLEGGIEAFEAAGGATIAKSAGLPASSTGRTRWVTRERPKVDRIACPWLIRRFVDPDAEILFVSADWVREAAVELGAIPFDIPDTDFSHDGERCSFDAFLARFDVRDEALHRLASIVRGADTAHLELAPEAAGLLALSLGLCAEGDDDHATVARGTVVYDALYAWARDAAGESHGWNPSRHAA